MQESDRTSKNNIPFNFLQWSMTIEKFNPNMHTRDDFTISAVLTYV